MMNSLVENPGMAAAAIAALGEGGTLYRLEESLISSLVGDADLD